MQTSSLIIVLFTNFWVLTKILLESFCCCSGCPPVVFVYCCFGNTEHCAGNTQSSNWMQSDEVVQISLRWQSFLRPEKDLKNSGSVWWGIFDCWKWIDNCSREWHLSSIMRIWSRDSKCQSSRFSSYFCEKFGHIIGNLKSIKKGSVNLGLTTG